MQRFTDFKIWQRSHALAVRLYGLTRGFPEDERYGLQSQLRRAAVSVASNIAEGSKRRHVEFGRFLSIAASSLSEVEAQLLIARDVGYVAEPVANDLTKEIDE